MEKEDNLREDVVELVSKTLAAEDVDCAEVWRLHATEPHVGDIFYQKLLHLTSGVHIVKVGVNNHLKQHPGIIAARTTSYVTSLNFTDIKPVNYCADNSSWVILGKIIAQTRRKKQIIVGIVRFKDYLCHYLIRFSFCFLQPQFTKNLSDMQ